MVTIQGNRFMSDFEAKKAMIEIGRRMDQKGYSIAGDGSLSVRTGPNAIWITTAGADKGNLTQDMFVKVGMDGKQVMSARSKELPGELSWHLKIYQEKPEVKAILQAYPPAANARAIKGQAMAAASYTGAVQRLGAVPVVCAAEQIGQAVRTGFGALAAGAGCIAWGETPLEAYHFVEAMEYHAVMDACLAGAGAGNVFSGGGCLAGAQTAEVSGTFKGVTALVRPGDPVNATAAKPLEDRAAAISAATRSETPAMTRPAAPETPVTTAMLFAPAAPVTPGPEERGIAQTAIRPKDSVMAGVVTGSHLAPVFRAEEAPSPAAAVPRAVDEPKGNVMAEVVRRVASKL